MIRKIRSSRAWTAITSRPHLPIAAYLTFVSCEALLRGHDGGPLPVWLGLVWSALATIGGLLAVLGCLMHATRTESSGLGFLAVGALTFGIVAEGRDHWALAVGVILMCLIRMRVLSLARHALEVATGLRDEQERCS